MTDFSALETMSRKDIQSLAKQHGIKANMKTTEIISSLRELQALAEESPAVDITPAAEVASAEEEKIAPVEEVAPELHDAAPAEGAEAIELQADDEWVLVEAGDETAINGIEESETETAPVMEAATVEAPEAVELEEPAVEAPAEEAPEEETEAVEPEAEQVEQVEAPKAVAPEAVDVEMEAAAEADHLAACDAENAVLTAALETALARTAAPAGDADAEPKGIASPPPAALAELAAPPLDTNAADADAEKEDEDEDTIDEPPLSALQEIESAAPPSSMKKKRPQPSVAASPRAALRSPWLASPFRPRHSNKPLTIPVPFDVIARAEKSPARAPGSERGHWACPPSTLKAMESASKKRGVWRSECNVAAAHGCCSWLLPQHAS